MKVTCPYCDSYVEVNETSDCPCCGAPLGEAIQAAQAQQKAEEAEAAAQAAATAETQAKEQTKQTLITAAASVLGAAAGSLIGKRPVSNRPMPTQHGRGGPGGRGPHGRNAPWRESGAWGKRKALISCD